MEGKLQVVPAKVRPVAEPLELVVVESEEEELVVRLLPVLEGTGAEDTRVKLELDVARFPGCHFTLDWVIQFVGSRGDVTHAILLCHIFDAIKARRSAARVLMDQDLVLNAADTAFSCFVL